MGFRKAAFIEALEDRLPEAHPQKLGGPLSDEDDPIASDTD